MAKALEVGAERDLGPGLERDRVSVDAASAQRPHEGAVLRPERLALAHLAEPASHALSVVAPLRGEGPEERPPALVLRPEGAPAGREQALCRVESARLDLEPGEPGANGAALRVLGRRPLELGSGRRPVLLRQRPLDATQPVLGRLLASRHGRACHQAGDDRGTHRTP